MSPQWEPVGSLRERPVRRLAHRCAEHPLLFAGVEESPRMPARPWAGIGVSCDIGAVRPALGLPDELVGEEGEPATDCFGSDEAHGFGVADLGEESLAVPEHDREDDQS
jgi:hypothetical protein